MDKRMEKSERCSNCLYNRFLNGKFVCDNYDSELYLLNVAYDCSCECWISITNERRKTK
jgi:hypothetical protein